MSCLKISAAEAVLKEGNNEIISLLSRFLTDLGEIWYKRAAHNAVQHLRVS
jgi:hypothetical protein